MRPIGCFFFAKPLTALLLVGAGIYQPSMNFLLELIKANQFVHVFPQGKVIEENYEQEMQRIRSDANFGYKQLDLRDKEDQHVGYAFRWGLARLILDALAGQPKRVIELLPLYHLGMDRVLPNVRPYIPKMNKQVTIFIREEGALRLTNEFVRDLCRGLSSSAEKRARIMSFLEDEMKKVKFEALKKHLLVVDPK